MNNRTFTDFEVAFSNQTVAFDITNAITNPLTTFEFHDSG